MAIIETLIWLYIAMVATVVAHELGHMGKRIRIHKWFPWVEGASYEVKYRYGGLAVNFVLALTISIMQPEHIFLQLFGVLNWVHFSLYAVFGSFNYEPKVPAYLWKYFVFDDVPNKFWYLWVPAGIINFILFKEYYIPIIMNIISGTI